jgi:hypothetical protein
MSLDFNSYGNLYQTIALTVESFKQCFLTNQTRNQLFFNALPFFNAFFECGCMHVFIAGSFISQKKHPGDIDICFDISHANQQKLRTHVLKLTDYKEIGKIRRELQCHIFLFDNENTELFEMLSEDRNANKKGMVQLALKDILQHHDQKRTPT